MKKTISLIAILMTVSFTLFASLNLNASEGMIDVKSEFDVLTTADRFENILKEKGLTLFNRISHSKNAEKIGMQLRETELFIFGNPKAGTPLMNCEQRIALDLPQKALVWKDKNNQVLISYNDISYLKSRHLVKGCEKLISKISGLLAKITKKSANK